MSSIPATGASPITAGLGRPADDLRLQPDPQDQPGLGSPQDPARIMVESNNDTRIDWGCIYGEGIFYVVDTGAKGPDDVRITIHADGSVTVRINDEVHEFDAESARNLRVRTDPDDKVQVTDERSDLDKAMNPEPVQVFTYPR